MLLAFWFSFRGEMHENWCGIQPQQLKHIGSFVEINHGKEQIIRIGLRIAIGVRNDGVFIMCVPANDALTSRSHCSKHDNHRIISRHRSHQILKSIAIEFQHGPLHVEVQQLLNTIG